MSFLRVSPFPEQTDRSRPDGDVSGKLGCIAFTEVMKSGHQREKLRNLSEAKRASMVDLFVPTLNFSCIICFKRSQRWPVHGAR